jgi:hypothetical protein
LSSRATWRRSRSRPFSASETCSTSHHITFICMLHSMIGVGPFQEPTGGSTRRETLLSSDGPSLPLRPAAHHITIHKITYSTQDGVSAPFSSQRGAQREAIPCCHQSRPFSASETCSTSEWVSECATCGVFTLDSCVDYGRVCVCDDEDTSCAPTPPTMHPGRQCNPCTGETG